MSGLITEGLGEDGSVTTGFTAISASSSANLVTITFATGFPPTLLTGDSADYSKWGIAGGPVEVQGVTISGDYVKLITSNMVQGQSYTVNIPTGILSNAYGFLGPYSLSFTGTGTTAALASIVLVNNSTIDVYFTTAPDSTALDAAYYSITGGVTIESITKLSDTVYRLSIAHGVPGQTYTLTWPV